MSLIDQPFIIIYLHSFLAPLQFFLLITWKSNIISSFMKYSEASKVYTSSNHASWFQNHALEGYQVPLTYNGGDFNLLLQSQKENMAQTINHKQQCQIKGHKFEKSQRNDYFVDKRCIPEPAYYFKNQTESSENEIKAKINESSFFKKYPRFQKIPPKETHFVMIPSQEVNDVPKHQNLGKADVVGFFDYAGLRGTWTPGPGSYDPKITRHRSLSHFSKSKKGSFPENHDKNTRRKIQKEIGPQTYIIPRSLSLVCSVKFKQPLKQNDVKIKEGVIRVNTQKQKANKAGPGKYLRIQEWCKYKENKKLMNGLNICSRPVNQLKIYT